MNFIKKNLEYLLFIALAIIGICTASSYGIAWDEPFQKSIGEVCYNYIFNNDLYYLESGDRDHGPAFELVLLLIEKGFNLTLTRDIYVMRHIVTHILFLASAVALYKLIFFIYRKRLPALFGFLFLIANPTIYGHSFFNSKDLPFLCVFIFCFYQFALAFRDKKNYRFILLGLCSCFLITIRIMGILFVLFVIFFIIIDLISCRKEKGALKKYGTALFIYCFSTIAFTIMVWPLLWSHPIHNFIDVFKSLSKFPWGGIMLYKGEFIRAEDLGWDYIPTWFCINTPIIYLVQGFCGILLFTFHLLKSLKPLRLKAIDKNNLLYLLCFFAPVLAIIFLHSIVYDSWRHLFYIYPAFIMLAVYFVDACMKTKYKHIVTGVIIISIGANVFFMITNFPFQYVYFNEFVSLRENEYIRGNYEMDYWGVSYNKSLEYILKTDQRTKIIIFAPNYPGIMNRLLFPEEQKNRLVYTDTIEKADYFITNYRGHPDDYNETNLEEIKYFKVLNTKINSVFKVKK